ncbi:hypothetical protein [Flavobacterium sp. I3-2]|uniref:hypothetical protein n=1 Tax=Flavobacterium sp. I3-2 TaxID=2748319 RepID=UPI0015B0D9A2|nr:hypothetical protein [Flavobacterium sp. I3-2]
MNPFNKLPFLDKLAAILIFISLAFWSFSKVPQIAGLSLFTLIYEVSWLYMIVITLITTFYFLYQWINLNLRIKNVYFYGFVIGVLTLVIMRFV